MSDVDAWVNAEFANLAQVIYEYDNNLRLEEIPPRLREGLLDKTNAYRIIDIRNNNIVMHAKATATPTEILGDLWSMDATKGDVITRLEKHNAAAKALELSREIDDKAARIDFSAFVFKNTKSRWIHEGRIRDDEFRDLGPKQTHIT